MGLPTNLDPQTDFGLPKENYADIVDPETEIDYDEFENLAIGLAGVSHTAPRAMVVVSAAGASSAARVKMHDAVWGDTNTVRPTVTATATGVFTITWSTSYVDLNPTASRQVSAAVSFKGCTVSPNALGHAHGTATGNSATVSTTTLTGTASNVDFTIVCY